MIGRALQKGPIGKLVSAISKSFRGAGKEAVEAGAKAWGKESAERTGRELTEAAAKEADQVARKIGDDLAASVDDVLSPELKKKLMESQQILNRTIMEGNGKLSNAIQRLRTERMKAGEFVERIDRTIGKRRARISYTDDPDKIAHLKHNIENLELQKAQYQKKFNTLLDQENRLIKVLDTASTRGREMEAVDALKRAPDLEVHPEVVRWKEFMNKAHMDYNHTRQMLGAEIRGTTSKNLNNNTKFLKEYLTLDRLPGGDAAKNRWLSNPQNKAKLHELLKSDRIAKMVLQDKKLSWKSKVFGVTPGQVAKNLGIAGVTGSAGVAGVYSFFGNNHPGQTAATGDSISGRGDVIANTPQAQKIKEDTDACLKRITALAQNTNKLLATDPAKGSSLYINGVYKELKILIGLLRQWDVVVKNSDNPRETKQLRQDILNFAKGLEAQIVELGRQMGVDMRSKGKTKNPDLAKLQRAVGVKETGVLDSTTIKKLQRLEKEFNSKTGDHEFTGAFVVPEIGHVIKYNNFMEARYRFNGD